MSEPKTKTDLFVSDLNILSPTNLAVFASIMGLCYGDRAMQDALTGRLGKVCSLSFLVGAASFLQFLGYSTEDTSSILGVSERRCKEYIRVSAAAKGHRNLLEDGMKQLVVCSMPTFVKEG